MRAAAPVGPRQRGLPPSALVLVGANVIPLVGVVAFQWTVFSILLLYWSENVVVGAFNILRMAVAEPQDIVVNAGKVFLIPFFAVHYGIFTLVHGMFVMTLFGPGNPSFGPGALLSAVREAGVGYGLLAIAASHAFSFAHNYLGSGEFRRTSPLALMSQPYTRVMVLHVTIIAGGFLAQALGAPAAALVVLITLKTTIDLRAHLAERRKLGTVAPAAARTR